MNKLFENPGKKVKTLALVIFWLFIAVSVVGCVVTFIVTDMDLAGVAFGILGGGIVVAWVSSVVLYAFGQLVEDNSAIRTKIGCAPSSPGSAQNNNPADLPEL